MDRLALLKLKEWERIFPLKKINDCILNIDIGIFFPYSNSEIIICEFGLINDDILKDEDTEEYDMYLFKDVTYNHRYPNKKYVTLSKKNGRKICKTGYPICLPAHKLNEHKMLILKFGTKTYNKTFCFPISVNITDDKPIGNLKILINVEYECIGFYFITNNLRYCLGKPIFGNDSDDINLNIIKTGAEDLILCTTVINIDG